MKERRGRELVGSFLINLLACQLLKTGNVVVGTTEFRAVTMRRLDELVHDGWPKENQRETTGDQRRVIATDWTKRSKDVRLSRGQETVRAEGG